jgi:F0F1-type ATP synthase assembly protein I
MFPGSGDQKELGRYLALSQVGMEMVAPIALGWLVDDYFRISPWGVIAGAVIGFIGGLAHLVRMTSPKAPGNAGVSKPAPPADDIGRGAAP